MVEFRLLICVWKSDNDVKSRIYIGWVKMAVQFEAVCGPKFMTVWDDVGDPLVNALDCLSTSCFVPKIYAVKVAVKLRSRP